jgi:vacuolar-type H+-ATPase subunit H
MTETAQALDAIRRVELETAQHLETARSEGITAVVEARRRATATVAQAKARGLEEAQRRYDLAVAAAREEARSIAADGAARAEQLRNRTAPGREAAIDAMVDLLVAPPLEEGK